MCTELSSGYRTYTHTRENVRVWVEAKKGEKLMGRGKGGGEREKGKRRKGEKGEGGAREGRWGSRWARKISPCWEKSLTQC